MKRKTRPTRRQLALVLEPKYQPSWPAETRSALIIALADLLLEALGPEEGRPLAGGRRNEPEDHD